jgi:hypothetical protein
LYVDQKLYDTIHVMQAKLLSFYIPQFKAFVEKKNRRAIKLGVPVIEYSISSEFLQDGNLFVNVTVNDAQIKLGNWNFVAKIENIEGENIVLASKEESSERFRYIPMTRCDHCNVSRRRNNLVVISNGTDEKIVGETCLEDFTGHKGALDYILSKSWVLDIQEIIDEEFSGSSGIPSTYLTESVLEHAAANIQKFGFTPKSAEGIPTAIDVVESLGYNKHGIIITEDHRKTVKDALEWLEGSESNNDYIFNLKVLCSKKYSNAKYFGFLVSLIPAYYRANKEKKESAASEWVGTVGEKIKIELTCVHISGFTGTYGYQSIYLFTDANGNSVVYKTNAIDFKINESVKLQATIKDHGIYMNKKQTSITRAKVIQ